ncbi:MAG: DUF523 domain-containing protein [Desulfobacterales bacterium]|nr:DUF523 domain-containing protein [Desulfobacterales bacterium]
MIAASACLFGFNCRYDAKCKKNSGLIKLLESEKILPICPEQLGGLPTPRASSNLVGGNGFDVLDGNAKVINIYGDDNTEAFIEGAYTALDMISKQKIRRCFLKDKSPSCGVGCRTQFSQKTNAYKNSKHLTGVTAALLIRKGIIIEEVTNFL